MAENPSVPSRRKRKPKKGLGRPSQANEAHGLLGQILLLVAFGYTENEIKQSLGTHLDLRLTLYHAGFPGAALKLDPNYTPGECGLWNMAD